MENYIRCYFKYFKQCIFKELFEEIGSPREIDKQYIHVLIYIARDHSSVVGCSASFALVFS